MCRFRFGDHGDLTLMISALSVALLGYAGGMFMAYPGVLLDQWELYESNVKLSTSEKSWFASIAQLVAIPGSVVGGFLMEKLGPRRLALFCLPISGFFWAINNHIVHIPWLLITCRAIQGLIITLLCIVGCVYPCEIADVKRRDFLGSVIDATFSLGFLATYIIGGLVMWKSMSYIIIAITIIPCFIGGYFAPESPIWLVRQGHFDQAVEELKRIRSTKVNVETELLLAQERAQEEIHLGMGKRIRLLAKWRYLLPVLATILLLILKETSGQFAVVLYVYQIFRKVNSNISSFWCSVIVGSTRLASNLLCCFLLSKIPRRVLIGVTSIIAGTSLGFLGTFFFLDSWHNLYELRYLPLILLMVFVICYGIGIGPTSWLLAAEMQPSTVRSMGSGLAQAGFNGIQWLIAGSFVTFEKSIGIHFCFWIYAGGCLFIAIFMVFLPETKGKTLAENEDHWVKVEGKLNQLKMKIFGQTKKQSSCNPNLEKLMEEYKNTHVSQTLAVECAV